MLYCPRCKAKYEKGTQRFCTNEGVRLLPIPSEEQIGGEAAGVFTRILGKPSSASVEEQSAAERAVSDPGAFQPPGTSKFFSDRKKGDEIVDDLLEEDADVSKEPFSEAKPAGRTTFEPIPIARLIDPVRIPEKRPVPDLGFAGWRSSSTSRADAQAREQGDLEDLELDLDQIPEPDSPAGTDPEVPEIGEPETDGPAREAGNVESGEPDEDILGEIQLDLAEPIASAPGDFELEMDEVSEPASFAQEDYPIELDLEHPSDRVAPEIELPKIELDLEDLDLKPGQAQAAEYAEPKKTPRMVNPAEIDDGLKAATDLAWEKRSDGGDLEVSSKWYLPIIAALVILALGVVGLMYLMTPRKTAETPAANSGVNRQNSAVVQNVRETPVSESPLPEVTVQEMPARMPAETTPAGVDAPPPPRPVKQPPNTVLFKNKIEGKSRALAKNFLGFSIYFPKDWKENVSDNKYLDISKTAPDGIPIEQFLVSRYDSKGTYSDDLAIFDQLVEKSNNDLKNILANYQVISEGETVIQNGRWKAYEVKFQGLVSGKKLILWGRRLWIPVQRKGMTSGFIITMIATSLAENIHSVEDIGVTGDLATILSTFEPDLK